MTITVADQYYIKALEGYPYDLEVVIEQLNYALSYDQEHVGALHLMGCMYMDELSEYDKAEEYFQNALSIDPRSFKVGMQYTKLLIRIREYSKASKLVKYLHTLKGSDKAVIYQTEALLYEYQKNYSKALLFLAKSKEETFNANFMESLDDDTERVQEKMNNSQPYIWSIE